MGVVDILLNIYNVSIAVMVIISSLIDFFHFWGFDSAVVDIYILAAATIIILLETVGSPRVVALLPIMKLWFGRGVLYIFLGVLCIGHYVEGESPFSLVVGIAVMVLGLLAIVFHFVHVPMSTPFLAHWRGQQVMSPQEDFNEDSDRLRFGYGGASATTTAPQVYSQL